MQLTQPNGHGKRIVRSANGPVWQACQCTQCKRQAPYKRPATQRARSAGTNGFLQRANAGAYNSLVQAAPAPPIRRKRPNLAARYTKGLPIGHSQHLQPLNHGTRWSS